jgi:hypothetical protein
MLWHRRFTPLHAAAWNGSVPVAEILLAHGADVNAKTTEGCGGRSSTCSQLLQSKL